MNYQHFDFMQIEKATHLKPARYRFSHLGVPLGELDRHETNNGYRWVVFYTQDGSGVEIGRYNHRLQAMSALIEKAGVVT